MTKPVYYSVNIPFAGFYGSWYSDALDHEESQWLEYEYDSDNDWEGREGAQPESVRLTPDELARLLWRHSDHGFSHQRIAGWYVEAFADEAGDILGFPLRARFEAVTSPREYNFETDRIFADIPASVCHKLWALSKADGHTTLRAVIRRRFTSRDGFISHYRNDLADWPRDLADWDHNELGTLLIAVLELKGADHDGEDFDWAIYYRLADGSGFYQAWSDAVDWTAFEKAREEARAEKAEEALADLTPDERAALEARADWRHGDAVAHPDQAPLFGSDQ